MENRKEGEITGDAGEYFIDWLEGLNPETATQYLRHFRQFLGWLGTDSQSLYERHRDNLASGEPIRRMWLGKKVTDYMRHMRDELGYSIEGEASGGVLVVQKATAGFLKSVGIEGLPGKRAIKVRVDEIPNIPKQDLTKVLNATGSYKNRAYIHFAKESGLRTGDVTNVPLGVKGDAAAGRQMTLLEAIADETVEFFTFEWKQQKTGRKANPAIGPEALAALREWHRHRTERLAISTEEGDPLFCVEKTRTGYTTKGGTEVKGTTAGDLMDESNMSVVFGQLVRKAGLKGTKVSIHSLRKYHKTNLEAGGCPTSWVNRLQGRKGVGTGGTYSKPDPGQLLEMYAKAYPRLRATETVGGATREEMALEAMRAVAMTYGIDTTKIRIAKEYAGPEDEIEALREAVEGAQSGGLKIDLLRGKAIETTQKIVPEDELEKWLAEGWRFKSSLNNGSGKCVIEK
ncbi:MAG: tyrosine-type recombinase/integrase [Candidatus Bathyarchaeota archaeon]|nr:tyrosine-type recombinase/integrase [Candidatus Bathyarchaeota archaeon]